MSNAHIEATFEIADWTETPFDEGVGVAKLTEALVAKKYSGGIEGTSTTKWLMAYTPDATATFVGIERVTGSVDGHRGTLVLLHDGTFENGVASASLRWCRAPISSRASLGPETSQPTRRDRLSSTCSSRA